MYVQRPSLLRHRIIVSNTAGHQEVSIFTSNLPEPITTPAGPTGQRHAIVDLDAT
jgi:hypothetical protein